MSIYDEFSIVDDYEERHTNRKAVLLACDVMLAYLLGLRRPLPELTAQAVKVAQAYKAGVVEIGALRESDKQISNLLKQDHFVGGKLPRETESIFQALSALLRLFQDPKWGGGAGEVLSNFIDLVDEFDRNNGLLVRLLKEVFSEVQ